MSVSLRFDIGRGATDLIESDRPGLLTSLGAVKASRWGGFARPRFECHTFGLRLPGDFPRAWGLLRVAGRLQLGPTGGGRTALATPAALRGCHTLAAKLTASLGLPRRLAVVAPGEEPAFITAIDREPDELAAWAAYADWLRERDGEHAGQARGRGEFLAAVLGREPIKTRHGMPDAVTEVTGEVEVRDLIQEILEMTRPAGTPDLGRAG